MHLSSYRHMERLVECYLEKTEKKQILDFGSYDVNGSYRPLFDRPEWHYLGIDLAGGPNVDIVLKEPYHLPIPSRSKDLIISGQAFEHVKFFWAAWLELVRVLKPGGIIFLIAPSRGPEHRYPIDCWRFYPDGFRALSDFAALELLEVHTDWEPNAAPCSAEWGDTVGVFRKPSQGWLTSMRMDLLTIINRWLLVDTGSSI